MPPTPEELHDLCREAVAGNTDLQFIVGRYMTTITRPGAESLYVNNTDLLIEFCRASGGNVTTHGLSSILVR